MGSQRGAQRGARRSGCSRGAVTARLYRVHPPDTHPSVKVADPSSNATSFAETPLSSVACDLGFLNCPDFSPQKRPAPRGGDRVSFPLVSAWGL